MAACVPANDITQCIKCELWPANGEKTQENQTLWNERKTHTQSVPSEGISHGCGWGPSRGEVLPQGSRGGRNLVAASCSLAGDLWTHSQGVLLPGPTAPLLFCPSS